MAGNLVSRNSDADVDALVKLIDASLVVHPGDEAALFRWNGYLYLGTLTDPYPEKPYIVSVRKGLDPLSPAVATKLRKQRRLQTYRVHPLLDFGRESCILGLSGNSLYALSGEDIVYCMVHRLGPVPLPDGGPKSIRPLR